MAKLPSISSNIPRDLRQYLERVRESIATIESEIRSVQTTQTLTSNQISGVASAVLGDTGGAPSLEQVQSPTTPTNVEAAGALANTLVSWNPALYLGHAYAEVWAAAEVTGGGVPSIGDAALLGTSPGSVFTHNIGTGVPHYYWVRFVNVLGIKGPFNATTGTVGTAGQDPEYLMEVLTEAYDDGTESPYFYLPNEEYINGVLVPAGTYMYDAFIFNGSISNAKIADAAIDTAKIADLAVTSAKILDLDATKITTGVLDANLIAVNSLNGDRILSASIEVDRLAAGVLSADNITTGTMSAERIEVSTLIQIDISSGGLGAGKVGAYDTANDGMYFGRTLENDNSTGFGFAAEKTSAGGTKQRLEITEANGLNIQNATFLRQLTSPGTPTTYTTDQTNLAITGGTELLTISLLGGGGGGGEGDGTAGATGENTVVQLLDSSDVVHGTWTASGGAGQSGQTSSGGGGDGQNSGHGTGGTGGTAATRVWGIIGYTGTGEDRVPIYGWITTAATDGGAATGYGAGGGGGGSGTANSGVGGKGGLQGQFKQVVEIDLTGITGPKLNIDIGAGGAGAVSGDANGDGGAGSPGWAQVTELTTAPEQADVIPLAPTSSSSFNSDFMGASTNQEIPLDYGPGFYVMFEKTDGNGLDLGYLEIDDNPATEAVNALSDSCVSFVAAKTPVVTNAQQNGNVTVFVNFYKMGA